MRAPKGKRDQMQKFMLAKAQEQFPKCFLLVTQNGSVIGVYQKHERALRRAVKKPNTRVVPPIDCVPR